VSSKDVACRIVAAAHGATVANTRMARVSSLALTIVAIPDPRATSPPSDASVR
jgi:hypothetical protein